MLKKILTLLGFGPRIDCTLTTSEKHMSAYTEKMVAALHSKEQWSYDQAVAFANENGLSVRSVISKIKSEKLGYTPKPKTKSGAKPVQKMTIVQSIAGYIGVNVELVEGLAKADKNSLIRLHNAVAALAEKVETEQEAG